MLTLAAPAKLNLYLHVTGKRADGYHLLDSLVAFVDIGDTLGLSAAPELTFVAEGPFARDLGDDVSSNLVVRVARALGAAVGRDVDIAFHLTKCLPVASGIGGGSADAAACLRGLALLWGLDPAGDTVLGIAATLGSDIPACVLGRTAFMGGIGTDLAPAPKLPPAGIVLVNPGIALPTPAVYRARAGGFSEPMRFETTPADARDLAAILSIRRNDLTAPAVALAPEIRDALAAIEASPGRLLARMSGSGATCFGLYENRVAADRAAAVIQKSYSDWWVSAGQLVEDAKPH